MNTNYKYFHCREIDKVYLAASPEKDLGFDYDTHEDFVIIGGGHKCDSEPVCITTLMSHLSTMQSLGSNYVCIDWHVDHQNIVVTGVEFRNATEEETLEHRIKIAEVKMQKRTDEIQELENRIKYLKTKIKTS
jgi:hypothetical protein